MQLLIQFTGAKERAYIREEFNSHRICLEHQDCHRLIVLEDQYGRWDMKTQYLYDISTR